MGWQDLLETGEEEVVFPWTGGKRIQLADGRSWEIQGKEPNEHGWYAFRVAQRKAYLLRHTEPFHGLLTTQLKGYLIGDRLIPDSAPCSNPDKMIFFSKKVFLLDPGLDRFTRISAGRVRPDGPLIYRELEFPLGPEEEVLQAFLDDTSIDKVKGVIPSLEAAFRLENYRKEQAEKRRMELEQKRVEEEAKRRLEERRQEIVKKLGDANTRREMAAIDFDAAARASLAVGDAVFLDSRESYNKGERIIRFRLDHQRFECTCDSQTLRIIDSGICLTAHYDDAEFEGGTKGDTWFTLESLPSVIREAIREDKLVVYRHAR